MPMKRGIRYRIYPNKEQKALMEKHFGSTRFVYNKLLEIKSLMYKKFRISILNLNLITIFKFLKKLIPS
jgi:putative transposase